MPQRGGMRHYSNQQMVQGGNLATFSESISGNNSNSQLLVTPQINQMPPPSHQGPPPHQSQVSVILFFIVQNFQIHTHLYYIYSSLGANVS